MEQILKKLVSDHLLIQAASQFLHYLLPHLLKKIHHLYNYPHDANSLIHWKQQTWPVICSYALLFGKGCNINFLIAEWRGCRHTPLAWCWHLKVISDPLHWSNSPTWSCHPSSGLGQGCSHGGGGWPWSFPAEAGNLGWGGLLGSWCLGLAARRSHDPREIAALLPRS